MVQGKLFIKWSHLVHFIDLLFIYTMPFNKYHIGEKNEVIKTGLKEIKDRCENQRWEIPTYVFTDNAQQQVS